MTRKWFSLAFSAAMSFVAAGAFGASAGISVPPAPPQPTTSPSEPPPRFDGTTSQTAGEARLRQWFAELADTNVAVRDRARLALMGLSVDGLGMLRNVVDSNRPLAPAQAAALHEIVVHVYIAGTEPDRMPLLRKSGFLGVLLEPVEAGVVIDLAPAPDPQQGPPADDVTNFGEFHPPGGVLIKETWAGFAGFRFLRVGDVVVSTGGDKPTHAPTVQELRAAVQATQPGQTLELQVLRQGRIVDVPVNVSARPPWAEDEPSTRLMQSHRLRRAEIYWQFAFSPLLFKDGGML